MKNPSTQQSTKSAVLKSKLLSYAALSSAFILTGGDAQAQCGTASIGAPLSIDIDNDGTDDLTIIVTNFAGSSSIYSSALIASNQQYVTIPFSAFAQTYVGSNNYYYGCQRASIPGQGSGLYNVAAGVSNTYVYAYAFATASLIFDNYYLYVGYNFYSQNIAYAIGNSGNNIIGLYNAQTYYSGANINLCQLFGYSANLSGNTLEYIGYKVNYGYNVNVYNIGRNFEYILPSAVATVASSVFPQSTCQTNSYATFGISVPPANPYLNVPAATSFLTSYYNFGSVTTFNNSSSFSFSNSYLAVKFQSSGETFNGWVELSYDGNANVVTCLNTGFNSCSIEDATVLSTASNSCIEVGQPDPSQLCCIPDLVINNFFSANPEFKVSNTIISDAESNGNLWNPATTINMTAETSIELISGFSIEADVDFSAAIDDCN